MGGGVGARGHADHPVHPPQRDHAEPADLALLQRPPLVVPAHQERARDGPRLVHVPGQHRPHAQPPGLPAGRGAAQHRGPRDQHRHGGARGGQRDADVQGAGVSRALRHVAARGRGGHQLQRRERERGGRGGAAHHQGVSSAHGRLPLHRLQRSSSGDQQASAAASAVPADAVHPQPAGGRVRGAGRDAGVPHGGLPHLHQLLDDRARGHDRLGGQVRGGVDGRRLQEVHDAEDPQRGQGRLRLLQVRGQELAGRDGRRHQAGRDPGAVHHHAAAPAAAAHLRHRLALQERVRWPGRRRVVGSVGRPWVASGRTQRCGGQGRNRRRRPRPRHRPRRPRPRPRHRPRSRPRRLHELMGDVTPPPPPPRRPDSLPPQVLSLLHFHFEKDAPFGIC